MDTTRDIVYRGFTLNDSAIQDNIVPGAGDGTGISGCTVDSMDISDVDVVQFAEKRSQRDGLDAGDVFLGARRIRMTGTLYALTRGLLFDAYNDLRAALNPVLAQRESPLDYGYRPLYFSQPTNRDSEYPGGAMALQMKAMPRAISAVFEDDSSGGDDIDSLALPWQATFLCKDPGIYGQDPVDFDLTAATSGTATNRGNYLSPANFLIVVSSAAGDISVTVGDSVFNIAIPAGSANRTLRFNGDDAYFTAEESGIELPQMSWVEFSGDYTWPYVLAGDSAYNFSFSGVTPLTGSHWWFYEHYA